MGARQHVERLPVVPGIGERAPVCAQQAAVLGFRVAARPSTATAWARRPFARSARA
jgi:hypothetical protein